jgi:enoyl-CoA hydratase/carnithine racemase
VAQEDGALASGKLLLDHPADGVARLRIDHGSRRGALDHEILDTLAATVAEGLDDVRALILTGTGPVFSAGYDLGNLSGETFERDAEALVAHPFHAAIEALEAFPKPIVAALNGHAIGGGLELALTCDLRIAASGVKVGMPPAKLGLVYSHTGLRKFLELCGPEHTAELFYVGHNVDAQRGREMGLIGCVVEPSELEAVAVDTAAEIAANAPLSVQHNKRILRTLRAHAGALPPEVERELVELREACFRTEDFREGVAAFAEKRAPRWRGR